MRYVDKQFLSPCYGETGSIVVELSSPRKEDLGSHSWMNDIDCSVYISDCSKSICLDFNFSNKEEMEKRMKKVDKMVEVLNNLKHQMALALVEYEQVREEFDKEKEKEDE